MVNWVWGMGEQIFYNFESFSMNLDTLNFRSITRSTNFFCLVLFRSRSFFLWKLLYFGSSLLLTLIDPRSTSAVKRSIVVWVMFSEIRSILLVYPFISGVRSFA